MTTTTPQNVRNVPLEELVHTKLESFLDQTEGVALDSLYSTIIQTVEKPLIQLVLRKTRGNQVKASRILGINRNTLRKKINTLNIQVKKN
ncbi:MAG: site-specific DNA inversion stimulation factor [Deltaproteobacteria bacterium]|nr:site-specific DNA inversion stimulation factor [Deltaproteobacteria bacterium]